MDQPKKQCQVLWSFLYKEIPKVLGEHATSKWLYFSCLLPLPHCLRLPSTWFSKMLFCWLTHRLYRAQCVWRSSWAHPLWAGSPISLAADASPSSKLFASCPSLVQTPASHGPDQMLTLVQTPPSCSSERMSILSAAAFTHVYSRFSNHYFRADLLLHM